MARFLTFMILLLWVLPGPALGRSFVQFFEKGRIDWTRKTVSAVGIEKRSAGAPNKTTGKASAEDEAAKLARRNLLEVICGVRIDSKTLLKDRISSEERIRSRLEALVANAELVGLSRLQDGSVKASVSLPLTGPFSDIVLPEGIRTISSVQQPDAGLKKRDENHVTGLVLDCLDTNILPGMAFQIVDEEDRVVYGSAYVSREHAVREGMAGYRRDLGSAQKDPRVADKPMIVKGIKAKTGPSDIMISNADAARIRGTPANLSLLQKCKVVIVIK